MGKSGAEKDIERKRGTFVKGTYGEDDTIHFRATKRIIIWCFNKVYFLKVKINVI